LFLNRELSWLEFNQRVLHEAEETSLPLLERLKFLAIFGSNLDEFFMKRVGRFKQQLESQSQKARTTAAEQLRAIQIKLRPHYERQRTLLLEHVLPELQRHGLEIVRYVDLTPAEQAHLRVFFETHVFPVLTPLGLDTS